ncbi:uncharacterized [Tachysurus ichikawai]
MPVTFSSSTAFMKAVTDCNWLAEFPQDRMPYHKNTTLPLYMPPKSITAHHLSPIDQKIKDLTQQEGECSLRVTLVQQSQNSSQGYKLGRKRASVRKEKWAEWVLSPAVSHKATMTDHGKQKEKKMENDFLHGLGVGVQESRDETEAESVHSSKLILSRAPDFTGEKIYFRLSEGINNFRTSCYREIVCGPALL